MQSAMPFSRYALLALSLVFWIGAAQASSCTKPIYLTFDTGNMAVAETVAAILKRQQVKATFFLANEKTFRGDYSLDDGWKSFWQERVKEGHQFGSHTYDHVYYIKDLPANSPSDARVQMRPQFGANANQVKSMNGTEVYAEINRVNTRFQELSNRPLDPIWRAAGGKTSPRLLAMAEQCGYRHIGWAPAGFLGDELSSEKFPNQVLLEKALRSVKPGDITMAHLGIWSRKDAWAPAVLEPLIEGWKRKGYCFDVLPLGPAKARPI
jgi:peptidoglycan/xylan/chitin deacetylase (PgdA/CDA1 family)